MATSKKFIRGIGSVLQICPPSSYKMVKALGGKRSDAEAISRDWVAVGNHILHAAEDTAMEKGITQKGLSKARFHYETGSRSPSAKKRRFRIQRKDGKGQRYVMVKTKGGAEIRVGDSRRMVFRIKGSTNAGTGKR